MSAIRKALVARFHQGWWFSATGWKSATQSQQQRSQFASNRREPVVKSVKLIVLVLALVTISV